MRNQDHNIDVSEQVEEAKKAKEAIELQLGTAVKPAKIGRLKKLLSFLHLNLKRTKHDIHHKPTYESRQVSATALDDIVLINHLDAITVELDHLIDADTHGQVLPVTKGVQNGKNPKNAKNLKSLKNKRLGDVGQFLIFNSFIDADNTLLAQKEQKEQRQKKQQNTQTAQKLKVLYVLVAEDISEADYSALLLKLEILKKGYLFQVMNKARMSLIKSIYKQYIDKKKIHENRVEKSQWEYHFNQILEKAIRLNSSDIHITAKDETATVMVRVHGDLQEIDRYTYSDMLRLISSAYNQLASIDSKDQSYSPTQTHETAIHRVINRQTYNLRFISKPIYPSGSFDVTMRLIDEDFYRSMKDIGYLDSQINTLVDAMAQPNGMVILAGRVGSGKSATIHSLSTRYIEEATINNVLTKKLVTFESPVEYKIKGAKQIEYKRDPNRSKEAEKVYFEAQVQSLLRMDSNACVLGEIRGNMVAELAVQLVDSNNIVLTTVHAQSALKIFNRLLRLGIDREVLTEPNFFLSLVYQSLVKVPCPSCALTLERFSELHLQSDLKSRISKVIDDYHLTEHKNTLMDNIRIINKKGCESCNFGVTGRTVVAEVVKPTNDLLEAFKEGNYKKVHAAFRAQGGITHLEHGLFKIFKGEICPLAFEDVVSPIDSTTIYDDLDVKVKAQLFKNNDLLNLLNLPNLPNLINASDEGEVSCSQE